MISLFEDGIFDLNCIDVSRIDDFSGLFFENFRCYGVSDFDEEDDEMNEDVGLYIIDEPIDISKWDVSNGVYFDDMFKKYTDFNCDLSKWDVSNG